MVQNSVPVWQDVGVTVAHRAYTGCTGVTGGGEERQN